jgi:hypothetical protein
MNFVLVSFEQICPAALFYYCHRMSPKECLLVRALWWGYYFLIQTIFVGISQHNLALLSFFCSFFGGHCGKLAKQYEEKLE